MGYLAQLKSWYHFRPNGYNWVNMYLDGNQLPILYFYIKMLDLKQVRNYLDYYISNWISINGFYKGSFRRSWENT